MPTKMQYHQYYMALERAREAQDAMEDWRYWDVTRPLGTHRDRSTLRYGANTPPEVGMFYQTPASRPLRVASLCSLDEGGVVVHCLSGIYAGKEHWSCEEDTTGRDDFDRAWKLAVIFPPDWEFQPEDYEVGLNPELARDAETGS